MNRPRIIAFITVPVLFGLLLIAIERSFSPPPIEIPLSGHINDVNAKLLSMSDDLSKFFVGLATSVIGGTAFYLGLGRERKVNLDSYAVALIIGIFISAVFSIFFGHLWAAMLRGQLVTDILDFRATEVVWPERLQYLFFTGSLCWFGMLILHLELSRTSGLPASNGLEQD